MDQNFNHLKEKVDHLDCTDIYSLLSIPIRNVGCSFIDHLYKRDLQICRKNEKKNSLSSHGKRSRFYHGLLSIYIKKPLPFHQRKLMKEKVITKRDPKVISLNGDKSTNQQVKQFIILTGVDGQKFHNHFSLDFIPQHLNVYTIYYSI